MHDVASHDGRTVLFVSHNLSAITELTSRAILLKCGAVQIDDEVGKVISMYLSHGGASSNTYLNPAATTAAPQLGYAEVLTSDVNGVHQFGEQLEFVFNIRHETPLLRGCFSFQVVNQFQQPILHAWALFPDVRFGSTGKETTLRCIFPSVRLNVGQYHLRTYLSEPPGGEVYETLDDVCSFEVIRIDDTVLWGWRPEVCAYHEKWEWRLDDTAALA